VDNYCYYHPAASGVSPATCDSQFLYPPSQRVCSCAFANCVDTGAFPLPHFRRLEAVSEEEGAVVEVPAVTVPAAVGVEEKGEQTASYAPDAVLKHDGAELLGGAALELSAVMKAALDAAEAMRWEARAAVAAIAVLAALLCARAVASHFYAGVAKAAPLQRLTKIAIVDSPSKASRRSNFLRSAGPSTPPPTQLHIDAPISVSPVV
jgi:hypothetical protein